MAFFARPILDNTQFVQHTDSTLTLSGQTQFATTSGLTLTDGEGGYVPIVATGKQNNYVLTYDGVEDVIKLKESTGGGTSVYPYDESSTCTVGGLDSGSYLYNCNIADILHDILVPTLNPTLSSPTLTSFTLTPSTSTYEVNTTVNIVGTAQFNPGSIDPQYPPTLSPNRTKGTRCYIYNFRGSESTCVINNITNTYNFGSISINNGNNTFYAKVCHCDGVQPYDSEGNPFGSACTEGITNVCERTIQGTYPWYWGIKSSNGGSVGQNRPTTGTIKTLINNVDSSVHKCVGDSNATLLVQFNSTTDDYLWFAIPEDSTNKICWFETLKNSGTIGGAVSAGGNLFPDPTLESGISSASPAWGPETYKIYISNYQTATATPTSIIELRNS